MNNAWETTIGDVLNVAHKAGHKLAAKEAEDLYDALDLFEIESEAMKGNDIETQTEYAYEEIQRQFDCLNEWKRIDTLKAADTDKSLIETLEWVQKSLNENEDPDLIIAEVANAIAKAKETGKKKPLEVKQMEACSYDVFIFTVVKVKVPNIIANSMIEAMDKAEKAIDFDHTFQKTFNGGAAEYAEWAEEHSHAFVDKNGDDKYENSTWFKGDLKTPMKSDEL